MMPYGIIMVSHKLMGIYMGFLILGIILYSTRFKLGEKELTPAIGVILTFAGSEVALIPVFSCFWAKKWADFHAALPLTNN